MNRILIVAEHDGSHLNAATAKCVSCAMQVPDAQVDVVVLGSAAVAAQAATLAGVAQVVQVENPANDSQLAAVLAPQIAALVREGYTHVFGPSTTFGKDLMPRVAALLDAPQLSDIMAVESARRFRRPIYAGNVILTVEVEADEQVIVATVRTASFAEVPRDGSASMIVSTLQVTLPSHTRFVSMTKANTDRPDLQTAATVVSGGRALGSAEQFKLIEQLAATLGAAVGASRAAVDAGYAPNELQVGQTGKIISPQLYIAVGISGAIQHMTGIKDAKTIVAINKDPDAPIFQVADYGLVADLFKALPELTEEVRKAKA
jgi:electron transfer flavoprotein alpha subunit